MANEQELITLLSFKVDDKSAGALRLQAMKLNQHYKQLGAETDKLIAQSNRLRKTLSTAIGQGSNLSAIAEHTKALSVLNEQFDQTTKRMEALEAQSTLISNAMKKLSEGPKTAFAQSTEAIDKQSASMEQAARSTTHVAQEMSAVEQEVTRLKAAWEKAAGAVADMRQGLANADQELARGLITQQEHADATAWMREEIERLSAAEKGALSAFAQADAAMRDQIATVKTATNAQKQHNAELAEGRRRAYQYGRVGMSFRAVGRGVARVAGVPTVEPLFAVGDIVRGIRGVMLLRTELPDIARRAQESVKSIRGMTAATTALSTAAEVAAGRQGLSALGSALMGIAPVAIPVTLALASVVTIFKHLRDSVKDAKEEIERAIEVNKQYASAISGAASEDVINQIEQNFARIRQAQVRQAGEELVAPIQGKNLFEVALDMTLGAMKTDLGLSKTRAAVDEYRKSIDEAEGEIKTLTATNEALIEGLRSTETAFEDYMVLAEKFPDAITQVSEDQLQAFIQNYNAFVGAMTSEEVESAIAKMRGQVALLEAEWDELNRRKEEGTLTDAGALRMDQIRPQIDQLNFFVEQLEQGLANGSTAFADFNQGLQKEIDQLGDAGERAVRWAEQITDLNTEIQKMAAAPGSPDAVSDMLRDLSIEYKNQEQQLEVLRNLAAAGLIDEAEVTEAEQALQLLNKRIGMIATVVYPAAVKIKEQEDAQDAETKRQEQVVNLLRQMDQIDLDTAIQALEEADPESVAKKIEELEYRQGQYADAIAEWERRAASGAVTQEQANEEIAKLRQEWQLTNYELGRTRDILLPAAQANKDYNDQLEREKELRQELIDQMKTDMQRRTDTRARVLTEEDPQNVIDDIRGIQLEILGWNEYLKDLDRKLKQGLITQEEHDDAAHDADLSIQKLTKDMSALRNEVLPAARETERFLDALDRWIAEMKLAEEQARVDADRARQLAREQEDFERNRARDIAEHYADLADLDAKLAEDIQKELARQREGLDDERKKELDEEAKHAKEMQRMAEDHRRKMLEIARDLATGLGEAVEDRSVSAAIEAIRRAREQTEDEQYKYTTEKKRREEDHRDRMRQMQQEREERKADYANRLAELRAQHAKEKAEREAAFAQRLAEQDEDRRIEAQRRREDWAREDAERRDHYLKVEQDVRQHYINQRREAQLGMMGVETEINTAWGRIQAFFASAQQQMTANIARQQSQINNMIAQQNAAVHQQLKLQDQWIKQQQQMQRALVTTTPRSVMSHVATGRFRAPTLYGTGTDRAKLDEWVILGDTGPEMARFHADGRWEVLNPKQTKRETGGGQRSLTISMPVAVYDASNPAEIEHIFDSRIMPKIIRQFERVAKAPRGRYY